MSSEPPIQRTASWSRRPTRRAPDDVAPVDVWGQHPKNPPRGPLATLDGRWRVYVTPANQPRPDPRRQDGGPPALCPRRTAGRRLACTGEGGADSRGGELLTQRHRRAAPRRCAGIGRLHPRALPALAGVEHPDARHGGRHRDRARQGDPLRRLTARCDIDRWEPGQNSEGLQPPLQELLHGCSDGPWRTQHFDRLRKRLRGGWLRPQPVHRQGHALGRQRLTRAVQRHVAAGRRRRRLLRPVLERATNGRHVLPDRRVGLLQPHDAEPRPRRRRRDQHVRLGR